MGLTIIFLSVSLCYCWSPDCATKTTKDIPISPNMVFCGLFIAYSPKNYFPCTVNPNLYTAWLGMVDRQYPAYLLNLRTLPQNQFSEKIFFFYKIEYIYQHTEEAAMLGFFIIMLINNLHMARLQWPSHLNIFSPIAVISHRERGIGLGYEGLPLLIYSPQLLL